MRLSPVRTCAAQGRVSAKSRIFCACCVPSCLSAPCTRSCPGAGFSVSTTTARTRVDARTRDRGSKVLQP
eukprot:633340-Pleurochrysis_carterae.AAC.1